MSIWLALQLLESWVGSAHGAATGSEPKRNPPPAAAPAAGSAGGGAPAKPAEKPSGPVSSPGKASPSPAPSPAPANGIDLASLISDDTSTRFTLNEGATASASVIPEAVRSYAKGDEPKIEGEDSGASNANTMSIADYKAKMTATDNGETYDEATNLVFNPQQDGNSLKFNDKALNEALTIGKDSKLVLKNGKAITSDIFNAFLIKFIPGFDKMPDAQQRRIVSWVSDGGKRSPLESMNFLIERYSAMAGVKEPKSPLPPDLLDANEAFLEATKKFDLSGITLTEEEKEKHEDHREVLTAYFKKVAGSWSQEQIWNFIDHIENTDPASLFNFMRAELEIEAPIEMGTNISFEQAGKKQDESGKPTKVPYFTNHNDIAERAGDIENDLLADFKSESAQFEADIKLAEEVREVIKKYEDEDEDEDEDESINTLKQLIDRLDFECFTIIADDESSNTNNKVTPPPPDPKTVALLEKLKALQERGLDLEYLNSINEGKKADDARNGLQEKLDEARLHSEHLKRVERLAREYSFVTGLDPALPPFDDSPSRPLKEIRSEYYEALRTLTEEEKTELGITVPLTPDALPTFSAIHDKLEELQQIAKKVEDDAQQAYDQNERQYEYSRYKTGMDDLQEQAQDILDFHGDVVTAMNNADATVLNRILNDDKYGEHPKLKAVLSEAGMTQNEKTGTLAQLKKKNEQIQGVANSYGKYLLEMQTNIDNVKKLFETFGNKDNTPKSWKDMISDMENLFKKDGAGNEKSKEGSIYNKILGNLLDNAKTNASKFGTGLTAMASGKEGFSTASARGARQDARNKAKEDKAKSAEAEAKEQKNNLTTIESLKRSRNSFKV